MTLSVGDDAPEFSLPDQDKQVVSLAGLRGTPVLLVFYPFAFSGLCTGELCQLRDELADYTEAGAEVLAISTDPTFTLKAFSEKAGMALRATFLVDAEGKVAFAEVNSPGDVREQSGWKNAVAELDGEAAA